MRGEPIELNCPFCDKGRIKCWYIPGITTVKVRSSATFGKTKQRTRNSDVWLIKSGCNICGKLQEDIEKELKIKNII